MIWSHFAWRCPSYCLLCFWNYLACRHENHKVASDNLSRLCSCFWTVPNSRMSLNQPRKRCPFNGSRRNRSHNVVCRYHYFLHTSLAWRRRILHQEKPKIQRSSLAGSRLRCSFRGKKSAAIRPC